MQSEIESLTKKLALREAQLNAFTDNPNLGRDYETLQERYRRLNAELDQFKSESINASNVELESTAKKLAMQAITSGFQKGQNRMIMKAWRQWFMGTVEKRDDETRARHAQLLQAVTAQKEALEKDALEGQEKEREKYVLEQARLKVKVKNLEGDLITAMARAEEAEGSLASMSQPQSPKEKLTADAGIDVARSLTGIGELPTIDVLIMDYTFCSRKCSPFTALGIARPSCSSATL
jgi:hypothetical protein